MEKIINCILLVDDNMDDNFFHRKAIERNGKTEHVRIAKNGVEAIAYLNSEPPFDKAEENPRPNIIFLDINMPKMNGFEFLTLYSEMDNRLKAEICIAMLSTSRNPDDEKKAQSFEVVKAFMTKPLDNDGIELAIQEFQKIKKS